MKRRILFLLLALVMVIGLLPVTVRGGELDNGLKHKVYENHVGEYNGGRDPHRDRGLACHLHQ